MGAAFNEGLHQCQLHPVQEQLVVELPAALFVPPLRNIV
jgi:hypothetical protein